MENGRALLVVGAVLVGILALGTANPQVIYEVNPFRNQAGGGGSCAQSTAYLAALPTTPSTTERNAFDTAVCAMVTNGFFPGGAHPLDTMYFFVNTSAANARINVIAPGTYNLVEHGTCTFTIDQGFTGDGSSCYEDTGFVPSTAVGAAMTVNNGLIGVCVLNNRTTPSSTNMQIGAGNTSTGPLVYVAANRGAGQLEGAVNNTSDSTQLSVSTAQGFNAIITADGGGSNILQVPIYNATTGFNNRNNDALVPYAISILAENNAGTIAFFSTDQLAYAFFGSSPSQATVQTLRSIMTTLITTLGAPNVC